MVLRIQQSELSRLVTKIVNLVTGVLRADHPIARERFSIGQEQMRQMLPGGWQDLMGYPALKPATSASARLTLSHPNRVGNCG